MYVYVLVGIVSPIWLGMINACLLVLAKPNGRTGNLDQVLGHGSLQPYFIMYFYIYKRKAGMHCNSTFN